MAISILNAAVRSEVLTESSTFSNSYTVSSGSDTVMVVRFLIYAYAGSDPEVSTATWNGASLTYVAGSRSQRNDGSNHITTEIWYLVNPDTGTHLISGTINRGVSYISFTPMVLAGASSSQPDAVAVENNTTASDPTPYDLNIITTVPNCFITDVTISFGLSAVSAFTGQTEDIATQGSYKAATSAGTYNMAWNYTGSGFYASSIAAFAPAGSSSSSSSCRSSSSSSRSSSSSSSSCRSSSSSCRSSSSSSSQFSSSSSSSSCRSSSSSSSCRSSSSSSSTSVISAIGYYFSTAGSNTTGNGSQGNPWRDFKGKLNGIGALAPGDRVYFKRGDLWVGGAAEVVVNSSGTSTNPIILDAYGSGTSYPVFAGAGVTVTGWVLHSGNIWRILNQTQTFLKTVTQDDNKALGIWRGTNSTLPAGTFRREGSTLYVHCWGSVNPTTALLRIGNFSHSSSADGARGLVSSSRLNGTTGSYVQFKNLEILGANGIGFSSSALVNKFYECKAIGCGQEGILFYREVGGSGENADGGRWFGGEVAYCAANGSGWGQGCTTYAPRVWFADRDSGTSYTRPYIHDNFMAGIDFLEPDNLKLVTEAGAVNCTVQNNGRFQDSSGSYDANIYNDGGSEIYIYGCVLSGGGTISGATNSRPAIKIGSEYSTTHTVQNVYLINNLIYNTHWTGIETDNANDALGNIKNITIVNNTIISYQAGTFDECWNFQDVDPTANNYVMRNNLFISSGASSNITNLYAGSSNPNFLDADYNMFWRVGGSTSIYRSGDSSPVFYTIAAWRTLTGEDMNSINADPQVTLISDTSPDVHLLAGSSPAINAGLANAFTPPSWLPTDIFPSGGAVVGYSTTDGIIDNTTLNIDIGYHYPTGDGSSSSSSSCCSSSSSCRSSSSSSSSCRSSSSSSSSSCRSSSSSCSSSSSSKSSSSSSSCRSSSSSSESFDSSSCSSCSSSSSSCRSSSSSSSSSSSRQSSSSSSSCRSSSSSSSSSVISSSSSSSSCKSSSSSCRSSSSSSRSSSSSSSSISNAIIRATGGIVKVSSTITFYQEEN